jgi:5'-3' exonuclease
METANFQCGGRFRRNKAQSRAVAHNENDETQKMKNQQRPAHEKVVKSRRCESNCCLETFSELNETMEKWSALIKFVGNTRRSDPRWSAKKKAITKIVAPNPAA